MSPKPTKNMANELRLDDITRRTILGVEEDLEDLRDDLADELQYYEERLRTLSDGLPEWLQLSGRTIRDAFRFPEDSPLPDGILGPRAVALAAADVESFILTWFEPDASQEPKNFALLETRDEFTRASHDTRAFLDDVFKSSKILANFAHGVLEDLIDTVLYELETKRRTDVNALDSLVQEGALDPGRDTQKETAEIWEEQRSYVEEVNAAFDPLMDLVDEGLALTQRGILELHALVERATQGRLGTSSESSYVSEAKLSETSHTELDDSFIVEQEHIDDYDDFSEEAHDTLPAKDLIASLAASTSLSLSSPKSSSTPQVADSHLAEFHTDDSHDEYLHDTFDNIPHDDSFDDSFATLNSTPEKPYETLRSETWHSTDEHDFDDFEDSDDATSILYDHELDDDVEQNLESRPQVHIELEEPGEIRANCFRVRSGWHSIPRKELAAILVLPTLFLVGIISLCCLYLAGMLDDSPLRIWGWTRGATTAAIAWLVVLPIMMNWYPAWRGWIPKFIRHYEDGENATALVDERRFSIERISCPLRDLKQVRVLRWESQRDRTRGWLLVIEPRYHAAVFLVTSEEDEILWFDSPLPRAEPPVDSWQLTPENFERLRERLEPSATIHEHANEHDKEHEHAAMLTVD